MTYDRAAIMRDAHKRFLSGVSACETDLAG